ncbi:MAG: DpnII family type II restriction endonuclease [Candidatus Eisenbacteria bacterium]
MAEKTLERQIEGFLATLTPEILAPEDYVDWAGIDGRMAPVVDAAGELKEPLSSDDADALAKAIEDNPRCLDAMLLLIGHTPRRLMFAESGKSIDLDSDPERVASETQRAHDIAEAFLETGIGRHLHLVQRVEDVLLGVLIGLQPNRRKNARGTAFELAVAGVVTSAVEQVEMPDGADLTAQRQAKILDKRVDYLVSLNAAPCLAIETNFFTGSGSKPSEVLERAYPDLQRDLSKGNVDLVVITDGAGWQQMVPVLERAFPKLDHLMNLKQAASGNLAEVLSDCVSRRSTP